MNGTEQAQIHLLAILITLIALRIWVWWSGQQSHRKQMYAVLRSANEDLSSDSVMVKRETSLGWRDNTHIFNGAATGNFMRNYDKGHDSIDQRVKLWPHAFPDYVVEIVYAGHSGAWAITITDSTGKETLLPWSQLASTILSRAADLADQSEIESLRWTPR